MKPARIARRTFLIAAGVVGGGLLVGTGTLVARLNSIGGYKLPAEGGEASFGAWLKLARDGTIEVAVPHQEMGQGIYSLAVLLAAEGLRLPADAVRAVQAPTNAYFANPVMVLDGLPFNEHSGGPFQAATVWTLGQDHSRGRTVGNRRLDLDPPYRRADTRLRGVRARHADAGGGGEIWRSGG